MAGRAWRATLDGAGGDRAGYGARPLASERADIVVPFHGSQAGFERLIERLRAIDFEGSASLTVVDNRPAARSPIAAGEGVAGPAIVPAPERQSSYFARNRGAATGTAEWIVFLDADVLPPGDLIPRYLATDLAPEVGVLAGGVVDEPPGERLSELSPAVAYAHLRGHMSQSNTMTGGDWEYAQTANCAVRRDAFEQVGGFEEEARSGGDADLCFRLVRAGWRIEERADVAVIHRSRRTLRDLLRQRARHGSGAAWLDRRYPGSFPRARYPGLLAWSLGRTLAALGLIVRGDREAAIEAGVEPLSAWAFELGRLVSNRVRVAGSVAAAAGRIEGSGA